MAIFTSITTFSFCLFCCLPILIVLLLLDAPFVAVLLSLQHLNLSVSILSVSLSCPHYLIFKNYISYSTACHNFKNLNFFSYCIFYFTLIYLLNTMFFSFIVEAYLHSCYSIFFHIINVLIIRKCTYY